MWCEVMGCDGRVLHHHAVCDCTTKSVIEVPSANLQVAPSNNTHQGMPRDQFQVEIRNTAGSNTAAISEQPALILGFEGSRAEFSELVAEELRESLVTEEIDASFRYLSPGHRADEGVIGLTDRVTGAYVLEAKVAAEPIREVVQAVREYAEQTGQDARYRVAIQTETKTVAAFDKELLAVYDADGTLLRHDSLIPTGVEL